MSVAVLPGRRARVGTPSGGPTHTPAAVHAIRTSPGGTKQAAFESLRPPRIGLNLYLLSLLPFVRLAEADDIALDGRLARRSLYPAALEKRKWSQW